MIRSIRTCKTTLNRIRRFRIVASLAAVLGCLSGIAWVPAHADTFPRALSVEGRFDVVTASPGTSLRIDWNFPAPPPGASWEPTFRIDALPITCRAVSGIRRATPDLGPDLSGSTYFTPSEPEFHAGASYYARVCLRLGDGTVHETNQVEIRLVVSIVGTRPASPLPGAPQITGALAANPVRPGYWIGVTGRGFGERPGAVLLETGGASHRLTDLDWHGRAIAGRVPRIEGVPDGPAFLVVQHASGSSNRWPVNFVATREVRVVPGGEFHVDSCSNEADDNDCGSRRTGAASFRARPFSYFVVAAEGESGVDQFSVPLANGWRFHELEYSIGNRDRPPTWTTRDRDSSRPHIQVHWRNPGGFGVSVIYGFDLYIIGPAGVPHR